MELYLAESRMPRNQSLGLSLTRTDFAKILLQAIAHKPGELVNAIGSTTAECG